MASEQEPELDEELEEGEEAAATPPEASAEDAVDASRPLLTEAVRDDDWNWIIDKCEESGALAVITISLTGCHPSEQVERDLCTLAAEFLNVVFVVVNRGKLAKQRMDGVPSTYQPPPGKERLLIQTHHDNGWVGVYRNRECIDSMTLPTFQQLRALVGKYV